MHGWYTNGTCAAVTHCEPTITSTGAAATHAAVVALLLALLLVAAGSSWTQRCWGIVTLFLLFQHLRW
jgi:hypothetical protein